MKDLTPKAMDMAPRVAKIMGKTWYVDPPEFVYPTLSQCLEWLRERVWGEIFLHWYYPKWLISAYGFKENLPDGSSYFEEIEGDTPLEAVYSAILELKPKPPEGE